MQRRCLQPRKAFPLHARGKHRRRQPERSDVLVVSNSTHGSFVEPQQPTQKKDLDVFQQSQERVINIDCHFTGEDISTKATLLFEKKKKRLKVEGGPPDESKLTNPRGKGKHYAKYSSNPTISNHSPGAIFSSSNPSSSDEVSSPPSPSPSLPPCVLACAHE